MSNEVLIQWRLPAVMARKVPRITITGHTTLETQISLYGNFIGYFYCRCEVKVHGRPKVRKQGVVRLIEQ